MGNINDIDSVGSNQTEQDESQKDSPFSDRKVRHAFIRKVYSILMVQLSFTLGIIFLFLFCIPVKTFVQKNQAVYWTSYGVFFVTYLVLVCIPAVRRKVPGNYICLVIFTIAFTYLAATATSYHSTFIILVSIGMTAVLCLALTLFAVQTKIDFTMCSGLIFAVSIVFILFGLATLIVYLVTKNSFATYVMNIVYGAIGSLVFSLYLVYDTQRIVGGRRNSLSPEEYIYGALSLYLDICNFFLIIVDLAKNCF